MINQVNANQLKVASVSGMVMKLSYADTGKPKRIFLGKEPQILGKIQLEGPCLKGNKFQKDTFRLNKVQTQMYREAVHGLRAFTEKELAAMPVFKKLQVEARHSLTQKLLNRLKQHTLSKLADQFLSSIWPESRIVRKMSSEADYYSDKDICTFSFEFLGITREIIIGKLLEWKILPENFYKLS